jgi:ABC-type transporter Mla subunit MlaD
VFFYQSLMPKGALMRKLFFIGVFGLSLLLLLRVYATTPASTPTWTVRFTESHGLMAGDPVEEAGRRIGQIVAVAPHTAPEREKGVDVVITVDRSAQERLRERATFLVTTPSGSSRPVLSLVVLDEKSPVLPPGSQIAGVESEIELEIKRQIAALDSTVRDVARQLDQLSQVLHKASESEEKRKLEESVAGLAATLQRTRDDFIRVVTEEIARWKKLYDKLFPPEAEKTTS